MNEVSITLTGPALEIRKVVDFWIGRGPGKEPADVYDHQAPKLREVRRFVGGLTKDGQRSVREIVNQSVKDQRTDQDKLWRQFSFLGEQQLNGVLGGVGNQWNRVFGQPNPFKRRLDEQSGRGYYQIDLELAGQIIESLGEDQS